jgi:primosomal protein N' (replication factor Y)
MSRRIARVLLDSPLPQLDRLFDYLIPDGVEVTSGVRVRVPLRTAGRVIEGYVVEIAQEEDDTRALSALDSVISGIPVLTPEIYRLTRAVADRAAGGVADVIRLAIPKRQVRVENAWLKTQVAEDNWSLDSSTVNETIAEYAGLANVLTGHRRAAVEVTCASDLTGNPLWAGLLAATAASVLDRGESAIVVVPDHRDIDLLWSELSKLVPETILVRNDSRLSNAERYKFFLRTLQDEPCIVIGNRSAIYSPVKAGLLAIWDDGDSLLAEPLAPYVHARDAALVRQEQEGSALLFASHTRSTDVERLVLAGWLDAIGPRRRRLPKVTLSTDQELDQRGIRMSPSAFRIAREALEHGPVLIQVARPGYSPSLVCATCRSSARCNDCGGPLGATRQGAIPTCGWCGRSARSWTCKHCKADKLQFSSSGSERTAIDLARGFPGFRVIVADAEHPVEEVPAKPALVVATRNAEPRAVGGYRAVILLDGARMLQAPQLRIGESCLRWWAGASALAAPDAPIHLVGVSGALAQAFASWTHAAYARSELADRAQLRMPPTVRTALIDGTVEAVKRTIESLAQLHLAKDAVLGPVPIQSQKPTEVGKVRALVRFDYSQGAAVATALRARVVAEAVARRARHAGTARTTLTVRLDMLDPEL